MVVLSWMRSGTAMARHWETLAAPTIRVGQVGKRFRRIRPRPVGSDLLGPNRERDWSALLLRSINRGEHLHDDAAFFAGHERPPVVANRLQEVLDLQCVIMRDWVDGAEPG